MKYAQIIIISDLPLSFPTTMQEVGRRLRGEGDDGEGPGGGGADVRARGVTARGDGGGGALRAAACEADGERAAPVGAQVRPPAAAATLASGNPSFVHAQYTWHTI